MFVFIYHLYSAKTISWYLIKQQTEKKKIFQIIMLNIYQLQSMFGFWTFVKAPTIWIGPPSFTTPWHSFPDILYAKQLTNKLRTWLAAYKSQTHWSNMNFVVKNIFPCVKAVILFSSNIVLLLKLQAFPKSQLLHWVDQNANSTVP